MKTRPIFELNTQGELIDPGLLDDIREIHRPDSPFLKGAVPYIIMALCGFIDGCFFYSLFSVLSYDRPLLLWVQIAGFIFGFDCIPIFAGIHYKRLKQGLTRDRVTFRLALGVCVLICAVNIGLRAATVDLCSPDLSENEQVYFFQVPAEGAVPEEEAQTADPVAWMVAVSGMVVPVVTSVGSFYISNHCYDPLLIKIQREKKLILRKADKIRRLNTLLRAYETDPEFEQRMLRDDDQRYAAARATMTGLLLEYYDYICRRLMEQQQNPAAISVLSMSDDAEELLAALDRLCARTEEKNVMPVPQRGAAA